MKKTIFILGIIIISIIGLWFLRDPYIRNERINNGKEIPIYIGIEFDNEEKIGIKKSIKEWNKALNGKEILVVEDELFDGEIWKIKEAYIKSGIIIVRVEEDIMLDKKGEYTIAFTEAIGGNIIYVVGDKMRGREFGVMLHEIGHLMGAEHTDYGLMGKMYNGYDCVDMETMEQVVKYNGWHISEIRYCK